MYMNNMQVHVSYIFTFPISVISSYIRGSAFGEMKSPYSSGMSPKTSVDSIPNSEIFDCRRDSNQFLSSLLTRRSSNTRQHS